MFKKSTLRRMGVLCLGMVLLGPGASGQQQPDTLYKVPIAKPRYAGTASPLLRIDGMHHNFHQINGNFAPFAQLARRDGYRVEGLHSYEQLKNTRLLVIANALHPTNVGHWQRPIHPAFDEEEIRKIVAWVRAGGSLLLIADHMPFAGAARPLAAAFGFDFCDGFAQLAERENQQDVFSKTNQRLLDSPIVDGTLGAKIGEITTFTGSSFTIPDGAVGVLRFGKGDRCLKPDVAWQFEGAEKVPIEGHHQGAVMLYGKGKVGVFGEAAMFTAQSLRQNGRTFRVGFNSEAAPNNAAFVRNVLYWLTDGP